jgi:hypothetical protein
VANYSAVIDLRVEGQNGLRTLADNLESINRLIKQVKPVPTLFDKRGVDELVKAKTALSNLVKAYADGNTVVAKWATSMAGLNQQMTSFRSVAANARAGSDEFTNALKAGEIASKNLLQAELERLAALRNIYTRQASGSMTATDQGVSKMVKDLLALKKQVPDSIAAMDSFQRELLEVQKLVSMNSQEFRELEQAIYKLDVAMGKVKLGPKAPPVQGPEEPPGGVKKPPEKPKGQLTFNPKPSQENLALGAGFPLLFGGGVGQVAGGLLGSMFGEGFGGQIIGAALGQQLEDMYVRIVDISKAAAELNVDGLRDSVITVNSELDYQVGLLVKANELEAARAVVAAEVYEQTGLTAGAAADIASNTDTLKTAWDGALGSISAVVAQIVNLFVPGIASALDLIGMVARGWANIGSVVIDASNGVKGWLQNLIFGEGTAQKVREKFGGINEQAEKLKATLQSTLDKQANSLLTARQLLDIDKLRNDATTLQGKLNNIELDQREKLVRIEEQYGNKKADFLGTFKSITAENQNLVDLGLKQIEAEKQLAIQAAEVAAQKQRQLAVVESIISKVTAENQISQAGISAAQQINALEKTRLEIAYQSTENLNQKVQILAALYQSEVRAAQLEYDSQILSIQLEEKKLKVQLSAAEWKVKEIQAEGQLLLLRSKSVAESEAIKNKVAIAVAAQNEVVLGLRSQLATTQQIGVYQEQGARAQAQNRIETAAWALQSKLVGQEIGFTNEKAQEVLAGIQGADLQTRTLSTSVNGVTQALDATKQNQDEVTTAVKLTGAAAVLAEAERLNATITTNDEIVASQEKTNTKLTNSWKDIAQSWVSSVIDPLKENWQGLLAYLGDPNLINNIITDAWNNLATGFDASVVQPIRNIWNGLMSFIKNSQNDSVGAVNKVWKTITGTVQSVFKAVAGYIASNVNKIIDMINRLIDGYNSIPNIPDIQRIDRVSVPAYAEGGVVTKPTLALVGEGGEPEYIIPQSKMAAAASNYLSGSRGASVMETGNGGGDSAIINIQTGPVMEMNGERYVTMADFERGLRQVAGNVYRGLRTPAGRYAVGIR